MKEKFDQIRANYERVKLKLADPDEYYENFVGEMAVVVDDMGFILEKWSTPGVAMSALSISRHSREVEREEVLTILEQMLQKISEGDFLAVEVEGADEKSNALMNAAVAGAMQGLLEGVISGIRKRGGHES